MLPRWSENSGTVIANSGNWAAYTLPIVSRGRPPRSSCLANSRKFASGVCAGGISRPLTSAAIWSSGSFADTVTAAGSRQPVLSREIVAPEAVQFIGWIDVHHDLVGLI